VRHRKNDKKLGRTSAHREAMVANLACSLLEHGRVITSPARAKAVKPFVEKMITLGKKGTITARRTAIRRLKQKNIVKRLFRDIAPMFAEREGGYTRIIRLPRTIRLSANETNSQWKKAYGLRLGDCSEQVFFELVGMPTVAELQKSKESEAKKDEKK
jgi:large subunit ribosomal protein L17